MRTIHSPDICRTAGGFVPTTAAARVDTGLYLTDEVFLYRVVGVGAAGDMVELEDCLLLDVARVPLADVRARRLRVVTPARPHD